MKKSNCLFLVFVLFITGLFHLSAEANSMENSRAYKDLDFEFQFSLPEEGNWSVELGVVNNNAESYVIRKKLLLKIEDELQFLVSIWENNGYSDIDAWLEDNTRQFLLPEHVRFKTYPVTVGGLEGRMEIHPAVAGFPPYLRLYVLNDESVIRIEYDMRDMGYRYDEFLFIIKSLNLKSNKTSNFFMPDFSLEIMDAFENYPAYTGSKVTSCCGYTDLDDTFYPCAWSQPYCSVSGNGNCTWWAHYERTCDLPDWSWHDANQWTNEASGDGWPIVNSPQIGAIANLRTFGSYGHVAYVTMSGTPDYNVREMGYCWFNCMRSNTYNSTQYSTTWIAHSYCKDHVNGCGWDWADWGEQSSEDGQCWKSYNGTSLLGRTGGYWSARGNNNDPGVYSPGSLYIDPTWFNYVQVRMRSYCNDRGAKLYFATTNHPLIDDEVHMKSINLGGSNGDWGTYVFNMGSLGIPWRNQGRVIQFRLDWASEACRVDLDYFKLYNYQPTAVSLSKFVADSGIGKITLQWKTSEEEEIAGWNITRATEVDGEYLPINESLIKPYQYDYEYVDDSVEVGKTYYYQLQAMDLAGDDSPFGPVYASPKMIVLETADSDQAGLPSVDDEESSGSSCGF